MSIARRHAHVLGGLLLVAGLVLTWLIISGSPPAKAATKQALVLGSTVSGGPSSREATEAAGDGFDVEVVDDATWGAMSAADFAAYELVIVGDPTCSTTPAVVGGNATALADAVMGRTEGRTRAGNRVLVGTDPVYHADQGGATFVDKGIAYAGAQNGVTNLYLTTSCSDTDYDGDALGDVTEKLLPKLTVDPAANWTLNGSPPCGGDVSLISDADQFAGLTSAMLRGWGCSVHMTWPTFPTDWSALAIATDSATTPTCGSDVDTGEARCGEAYILVAGSGITAEAPNLALTPGSATNPVGTQHTVTATVTNPDDSARSGVAVSFVVTGANAGAAGTCAPADCATGSDGKVAFTYTGTNPGDDTINAAITVDGSRQTATASKTWVATTSPEGPAGSPTCTDGIDNDGDGQTDAADSDCATTPPPSGEIAYAVTKKMSSSNIQRLVSFDVGNPGTLLSDVPISGLVNGEQIQGLDYRPANGRVYLVGRKVRTSLAAQSQRIYRVDLATGAATQLSTIARSLEEGSFGVDFNPTGDRLRVTSSKERNLRIVPGSGATTVDGVLRYVAGDKNAGRNPNVVGSAYSNNVAGAATTTLYDIDTTTKSLVRQDPPNDGILRTVGSFGSSFSDDVGFDISGATGIGYTTMVYNGATPKLSRLRTINLTTGKLTLVGTIGTGRILDGLTIVPASAVPATAAR